MKPSPYWSQREEHKKELAKAYIPFSVANPVDGELLDWNPESDILRLGLIFHLMVLLEKVFSAEGEQKSHVETQMGTITA